MKMIFSADLKSRKQRKKKERIKKLKVSIASILIDTLSYPFASEVYITLNGKLPCNVVRCTAVIWQDLTATFQISQP